MDSQQRFFKPDPVRALESRGECFAIDYGDVMRRDVVVCMNCFVNA
jgi:hypothetical protein